VPLQITCLRSDNIFIIDAAANMTAISVASLEVMEGKCKYQPFRMYTYNVMQYGYVYWLVAYLSTSASWWFLTAKSISARVMQNEEIQRDKMKSKIVRTVFS
jgi:hypothetical protein